MTRRKIRSRSAQGICNEESIVAMCIIVPVKYNFFNLWTSLKSRSRIYLVASGRINFLFPLTSCKITSSSKLTSRSSRDGMERSSHSASESFPTSFWLPVVTLILVHGCLKESAVCLQCRETRSGVNLDPFSSGYEGRGRYVIISLSISVGRVVFVRMMLMRSMKEAGIERRHLWQSCQVENSKVLSEIHRKSSKLEKDRTTFSNTLFIQQCLSCTTWTICFHADGPTDLPKRDQGQALHNHGWLPSIFVLLPSSPLRSAYLWLVLCLVFEIQNYVSFTPTLFLLQPARLTRMTCEAAVETLSE